MRIRSKSVLSLPSLGLLTLALSGCQSEGTKFDAPGASASSAPVAAPIAPTAATAGNFENAPGLPPVVEVPAGDPSVAAPPLTPVEDAASATKAVGQAIDEGVRRTGRQIPAPGRFEGAIPPAPGDGAGAGIYPDLVAPVVDAAKGQVNEAVGEVGRGARQVAEGVTQGVRQTADEVTQGVRDKADGLKQGFRKATDDLSQKARETTHKTTSGLLNKIKEGAKETVKGVKETVQPPADPREALWHVQSE